MTTEMFKENYSEDFKQKSNINKYWWLFVLIGVYFPLQIFSLLAIGIATNLEGGLPWDLPISLSVHAMARPYLDLFASYFTQLGIYWGVAPFVIFLALIFLWQRKWRSISYLVITALGAIWLNHITKLTFHRPRPQVWELFYPLPSDFAFPSGHALSSMVLVVILANLTWGTRWYKWVLFLGSLFVLGIGWTRVYLGVHYPSDVLAGWMLAIAWGIGVSLLLKPYKIE